MTLPRLWLRMFAGLALAGSFSLAPAGEGPWAVPLGPSPDPVGPFAKVRLPKIAFKGDEPHGAALSLQSRKAVVCYLDAQLGLAKRTKVILCDLTRGTVLWQADAEGAYFPFDLDATGTRILCRRDHMGTGMKDTAELWTYAPGAPASARRWVPYADETQKERDLIWAAFAGAGRLVTLSSGGRLVVWDAATLKRLHSVAASADFPAVSPNGNYIAFVRDASVGLLDVATGAVVGFLPLGGEVQHAALAFRSDGQALLCAAKDKVILVDPAAGRSRSYSVPGVKGHGLPPLPSVGWADDRLLFVNDYLVDPAVPVPIWHYMNGVWSRPAGGHVWFLATKGMTEAGLVPVRLPHASAVKKIMAARGGESGFLLKPGDAVQVDVRQVPKEHQGAARRALESVLRATEYQPAPAAPLVLEAVPGEERFEERTYTLYRFALFGAANNDDKERRETQRFRVQPVDVRLLKDGKVVWDKRTQVTPGAPPSVSLSDNESLTDRLAQFSAVDYGILGKVELPKFLQEQLGRGVTRMSLGHSTVGPDGLDESSSRREEIKEKLDALRKARQDGERPEPLQKARPKRTKL